MHWAGVEPGRRFRRVPLAGDSPLALAVRTSTPVWIGSRAEYVAAFPQSDGEPQTAGEIACACLPLVARDGSIASRDLLPASSAAEGRCGSIGGLMFALDAQHDFTDDERTFLVSIASQCANAIERVRLLESLEAANRAKDEFLALLGHELRNPLAPIVTALSLMKLRRGDHERERAIIERQVDHLVRLVDDLLDISKITRGSVELVRAPIGLAAAIAQAVEIAQPLLVERRHQLSVDVPLDLHVDADFHRVAQVIGNLLANAAKYTPDLGRIWITAEAESEHARIAVRDNGTGIAANLLPRVFDMFVQGERTLDRAEGGLGLGLAIVKNLVELHGGRVRAHSEGFGAGSTFTIWLPLAEAPAATADAEPEAQPTRPLRVLVVDDNVDAAMTMGELLRALGHEPVVVYDAPSALASARDQPPELALVDLGLPLLDGCELVERIRELPGLGQLRAVAVTGYGQASDRARTAAAGFIRHVVKPVGLEDLRRLLASIA